VAHAVTDLPHDELSGQLVADRFLLGKLLGRGGFGAVYEGRDTRAGGAVAVKAFRRSEGLATRAEREARTASKLEHPNIHTVLGVEHDDDHAYLVSRLVVGERFDRTDLSDEEAVRAIAAVADALDHAHSRGVVHRDVKPANILVSTDGDVRLTDFGIARDEDTRDHTGDERVLGTLSYMAPEQARGRRASGASDVWAAALTLYARLAGRNPYRAKSLGELLERLGDGAPALAELRPDLPRELTRPIMRALAADPARRPSAAQFRDQLLESIRPESDSEEAPIADAVPAPEPKRRKAAVPVASLDLPLRVGGSLLAAASLAWTLGAFPVYPPLWTPPLAALVGWLAWRRPLQALTVAAALLVPAFWNHAEAAGIAWIALAGAWIGGNRRWPAGRRCLSPLCAVPLALAGLGPAYVLVAATAPSARRRAAEAVAGGIVMLVAGNGLTHHAVRHVAGANQPLVLIQALGQAPQAIATIAAMVVFAVLLAPAWHHRDDRRLQGVVLWGVGFALAVAGLPQLVADGPHTWVPAAVAAMVAAIIPAAWALASPRLSMSR
jgi:eukaryotic-like serine/threonine-protein kinase